MKILMLHVATDLYGSSKILYLVARKLREDGHEVHLVVSEDGPLLELFNQIGAKTNVIRLGVLRKRYMNLKGLLNRAGVLFTSYFKLRRLISSEKIDIIYTNTTPVIIGGILSKLMGIPNIWHLHEIMDPPGSILHKVFAKIIKSSSVRVIAVSDAVYNNWLPFIGNEKLKKIYNGIPIENNERLHTTIREELQLSVNNILIGMIGRLNLHKGQFYFLEIAKELISNNAHLKFIVVGDAFAGYEYLYEKLDNRISSLGLEKHVVYLGYRSDIAQIMKGLDIFVLPSIKPDPFPTVVLEAMSLSKPVVATAQGGALEQVLDKVTGFHIPIDDAKKAASIMQPLLINKEMREHFGKNGKARLEAEFTLTAFENNISQLIHSIH
ncbi:MAG: glycosyltransferase family 4 protein [Chitinophagaceae bacterium]